MKYWCWLWIILLCCSVAQAANPVSVNSFSMQGILGGQLSDEGEQFKQAMEPSAFEFPRDHLLHQAYKTEWWYLTGNLSSEGLNKDEQAALFSYQFTLFRFALRPEKSSQENSHWRSTNIYMAHAALTDINQQKFYQQERFSRDGLALAGAAQKENGQLQFWLNDWQIRSLFAEQLFPFKLTVKNNDFTLDLQLEAMKPLVLQGDRGLSRKSSKHASYYYSYTRLASRGKLIIGDKSYQVTGDSWFDREWSTSSLANDQQGWDWFALHLDDGSELMLYQMRKKNGVKGNYSSGTLIDTQGNAAMLQAEDFQLEVSEYWHSPVSDIRYPVIWSITIPEKNIHLTVSTRVKHQEWSKAAGFSFNYWEGGVVVSGNREQQKLSGTGYLEMTGYD